MKKYLSPFIILFAVFLLSSQEEITVKADQSQITYPLWIEKGTVIKFKVDGSWTMWEKWEPVDYNGHTNFQKVGAFYLGTLAGRVEGGEDFAVTNNLSYKSKVSGRLILYPNRGDYAHLKASGEMLVTVTGAKKVDPKEAESLAGWDISVLDTARNEPYLTENEKDVILLLNKVRSNPPLFAKQYMGNIKNNGGYTTECYNELLKTKPLPILKPSKALFLASRDHAVDMGKKGLTGHNGTDGSDPAARVNRYGKFTGPYTGPWENCSYGFENSLDIILQLLIDDGIASRGHRKNILSPDTRFVGTAVRYHKEYGFNCVQDFADSIEDL
jgi:uncharacterized protein YkwD